MSFRATPDTGVDRDRLEAQRRRVRLALSNGCPVCERPLADWPMCFRGDRACSVNCQKALAAQENPA